MKNVIFVALAGLLFLACGSEKRQNVTTLDEDGNIIISEESIEILEGIQADYLACKMAETDERECNHFTAEAICRFYQIDDFKNEDEYISYSEIKDIVTLNGGTWQAIGLATQQADLEKAQQNANDARATIAFDPLKSNHVAIILPGKLSKSNQWGMDVPNSASFFVHEVDSYINKGLSYSFSSPQGIILYTKK